jgi:hypothetical protein
MAWRQTLVVIASAVTGLAIVVLAGAIEDRQAAVVQAAAPSSARQSPADPNEALRIQARFAAQRHFLALVQ